MRKSYTEMQAVDLNRQTGELRVSPERIVQRRKLALVSSGKVEFSPAGHGTDRTMFKAAEMRHNFAIWGVKNKAETRAQRHLYYCIRCKQAFSVNDSSGSVTPLDSIGKMIQGSEAIRRLNTFNRGPCAAFGGLEDPRLTSKLIPIHAARGRLPDLILAGRRVWKALMAHWQSITED